MNRWVPEYLLSSLGSELNLFRSIDSLDESRQLVIPKPEIRVVRFEAVIGQPFARCLER